mmetsp:Transcript_3624/g.10439  ORF Transcript_3624/g.10439 Transcript_3624/m.10439 type:complete len:268 (-) Transcript_3624:786-1589(-)
MVDRGYSRTVRLPKQATWCTAPRKGAHTDSPARSLRTATKTARFGTPEVWQLDRDAAEALLGQPVLNRWQVWWIQVRVSGQELAALHSCSICQLSKVSALLFHHLKGFLRQDPLCLPARVFVSIACIPQGVHAEDALHHGLPEEHADQLWRQGDVQSEVLNLIRLNLETSNQVILCAGAPLAHGHKEVHQRGVLLLARAVVQRAEHQLHHPGHELWCVELLYAHDGFANVEHTDVLVQQTLGLLLQLLGGELLCRGRRGTARRRGGG